MQYVFSQRNIFEFHPRNPEYVSVRVDPIQLSSRCHLESQTLYCFFRAVVNIPIGIRIYKVAIYTCPSFHFLLTSHDFRSQFLISAIIAHYMIIRMVSPIDQPRFRHFFYFRRNHCFTNRHFIRQFADYLNSFAVRHFP